MIKRLTAVLMFAAAVAAAQVNSTALPRPANLSFEDSAAGEAPASWAVPTPGFAARVVEGGAAGSNAASLAAVPAAPNAAPFGNLMQSVDATPYRGKWVTVRASIKVGPSGTEATRAQLWLRVDRAGGRMGFFDNMMNRPVRARTWAPVEITGDVAGDATSLNFGLLMLGGGEALIDDVSITAGPKVKLRGEPPRALDARGLANLVAFARLFGYVRHFHPSDQAATADWNALAVNGVLTIEGAANPPELARKLQVFFQPLAPTVEVYVGTGFSPSQDRLKPVPTKGPQIMSWRHTGFGQSGNRYHSERIRKDAPANGALPIITADLGGGISARIPLAVFADAAGTLPKVDAAPPASTPGVKFSGNDRATRLADVVIIWNVLQHFYPYFDVVKVDWPAILPAALTSAATDAGELAFLHTLRTMMAALRDGHGRVFSSAEPGGWSLPLLFGWIDDQLVITHVAAEGLDIKPGDIVERIDGKPARLAFAEAAALAPGATEQYKRWGALQDLRIGGKDSEVRLDVKSGGETRPVVLRRTMAVDAVNEPRPPKLSEIEPGIFYVDLSRIKDADFDAALEKLAAARGVIFDLRGYPSLGTDYLAHLTGTPIQSARWNVPIITRPDHAPPDDYDTSGRWNIQPKAPQLRGKIAFLTDGRAISYAESVMGIIEAYKLAAIVGEPTAGTNGNINPTDLPGDYRVIWTGMRVLKHDGSQHHGVGIQPTVRVSPTLQGVAAKRDEQLEAAVRIVKGE